MIIVVLVVVVVVVVFTWIGDLLDRLSVVPETEV